MNLRKNLLAASIAALPLCFVTPAQAANPVFGSQAAVSPSAAHAALAKVAARRAELGLDEDHGYVLSARHPGAGKASVVRANHTYKGVRVFGSNSVIVTDANGNVLSESHSDRREGLGQGSANKSLRGRSASFDVKPALSSQAAIDSVLKPGVVAAGTEVEAPSAELIIYPLVETVRKPQAANKAESALNALDVEEQVTGYELAYLVKTRQANGNKLVFRDTIVSANDGRQLAQWNSLQTAVGTGYSQYNGTVPINTSFDGTQYKMLDATRGTGGKYGGMAITNANHSSASNPQPGAIYVNSSNNWGDGKQYIAGGSTTNANGQTAAVNALWGVMNTYDAMKNVLGWQSLDGLNTATYIAVHVDTAYDNAFYSDTCQCMYIGDGSSFYNLGSIDVIGHEMGHGVTAATSNLTYAGESGGLNESSSDINGEMVEAYARAGGTGAAIPATGNDWVMGKEISKSGTPLRWMWKPSKDGSSPDAWNTSIKNLDVHYSSGPNNRMFYFLSQGSNATSSSEMYSSYLVKSPRAMTGIGNDKAFRIWFKANTTKFTASTNYADARSKMMQAAQELYGVGSKEDIAVQRAYAAINVGADVDEPGSAVLAVASQPASQSVAPGATASFAVSASGGTAPYSYQWLRNGSAIAGATSASYSLTAQSSDNGAVFSARITDATAASVTSNGATLTVTTSNPSERVTNGGFESGATGWSGSTGVIGSFSGQAAYEGTRYAWLGGNGRSTTETLSQVVSIPSTATSASLSFALHIDTAETSSSSAYDKLVVSVKNASGSTLATLATYSNLNKASGFQIRSFSLLPYKGQTVTLSFAMTEDSTLQTSFVVDKVSLVTQ